MKIKLFWAGWPCRMGLASLTAGTSVSSLLEDWVAANWPSRRVQAYRNLAATDTVSLLIGGTERPNEDIWFLWKHSCYTLAPSQVGSHDTVLATKTFHGNMESFTFVYTYVVKQQVHARKICFDVLMYYIIDWNSCSMTAEGSRDGFDQCQMLWLQLCAPDDGCSYHTKHVERAVYRNIINYI